MLLEHTLSTFRFEARKSCWGRERHVGETDVSPERHLQNDSEGRREERSGKIILP